jgi:hypothetical protein
MTYVPGFSYDLFISYCSDDLDDKLTGFIRDLRLYLRQELGREFSDKNIFFDRVELNITPVAWKETLRTSAGSAALFVPILSPGYATSEYCAKEWEWFSEEHPLRWNTGTETIYRICPVLWRQIHPELLAQIPPEIAAAQQRQSPRAEDLGAVVANGLRLLQRPRPAIYVGETDHEIRRRVRDELSRMGFRARPESPMAYRHEESIRTLLGEAKAAIHFVGGQPNQRAIDAIRWSREFCQGATIVYEIPGFDLSPEEKLQLEWLENDLSQAAPGDSRVYDRISGRSKNLDQFLAVIRDRLEGERPVPPTQIGIAFEEFDRLAAESIVPEIQGRTAFSVICHGMSLLDFKKSRGILFYWGAAPGSRLRQARPVVRASDAFLFAPPPKPEEAKADLRGCEILYQTSEQFQIHDIRPFLERLGWKG